MGSAPFKSEDWKEYKKERGFTASSTASDMYKSTDVKKEFEPVGIKFRESCDSVEHPNSTPIILALDVTGSMGSVLETVSKKIGDLVTDIHDRKPVTDPQVMIMAFGDVECDRHPLQVTQFESDIKIAEQLNDIYFERCGGGNDGESYTLPWYFAARHTKLDSFEKRGKKGFLFTFGDEKYLPVISSRDIEKFVGDDSLQGSLSADEILAEVSRQYEVYHLLIEEGSGMYGDRSSKVVDQWQKLIGQRAIRVSDCTKIPEIIVSILEVASGKDADEVAKSWDGSTSVVVSKAISGLKAIDGSNELVEF